MSSAGSGNIIHASPIMALDFIKPVGLCLFFSVRSYWAQCYQDHRYSKQRNRSDIRVNRIVFLISNALN